MDNVFDGVLSGEFHIHKNIELNFKESSSYKKCEIAEDAYNKLLAKAIAIHCCDAIDSDGFVSLNDIRWMYGLPKKLEYVPYAVTKDFNPEYKDGIISFEAERIL